MIFLKKKLVYIRVTKRRRSGPNYRRLNDVVLAPRIRTSTRPARGSVHFQRLGYLCDESLRFSPLFNLILFFSFTFLILLHDLCLWFIWVRIKTMHFEGLGIFPSQSLSFLRACIRILICFSSIFAFYNLYPIFNFDCNLILNLL